MRFLYALALLLAPLALAQTLPNAFLIPAAGFPTVTAGQPVTLNWDNLSGNTVTLMLRSGNPGALDAGTTIKANIPNTGTYTWTPPSDTPAGTQYTIEIINDQDPSQINYTPQFTLISSTTAAPSTASVSSTASAPASASASASASSTVTMTVTATGSMTTTTNTASSSGSSTSAASSSMKTVTTTTTAAASTTAAAKGNGASRQAIGAGMGMIVLAAVVVAAL